MRIGRVAGSPPSRRSAGAGAGEPVEAEQRGHRLAEAGLVVDDLHRPAAEHVARPDEDGIADPPGHLPSLLGGRAPCRLGVGRCRAGGADAPKRSRSSARSIEAALVPKISDSGSFRGRA